jgi:hypothetical protein
MPTHGRFSALTPPLAVVVGLGACAAVVLMWVALSSRAADDVEREPDRTEPVDFATIQTEEIDESSGVAVGHRNAELIWTHNDSGDGPYLYALDHEGKLVARVTIETRFAEDWEDMCSFTLDDKSYLLVGDFGDNARRRRGVALHLIEEPQITPADDGEPVRLSVKPATILVQYPDGAHDCEAIAVHAPAKCLYTITKSRYGRDQQAVYTIDLPADPGEAKVHEPVRLKREVDYDPRPVTAMDISPDGRLAAVLIYGGVFVHRRDRDQDWPQAFAEPPLQLDGPAGKAEAIGFTADGKALILTTEGFDAPLMRMELEDEDDDEHHEKDDQANE